MSHQEFQHCLEEVLYGTINIEDPYDRVTIMQWIRKLKDMDDRTREGVTLRNNYANYMRITLANDSVYLCPPFNEPPPETDLRPLCEVLANYVATKCPPIPMTGPIEPIMSRTSDDGKVFMTVKQSPDYGIYCYMAVSPNNLEEQSK